jgi:nitrite reductase/ring-hydroxylating ferredoxin subunit
MKPAEIVGCSTDRGASWSAQLADIQPGCSAKFQIHWQKRMVEGFVVNVEGRYFAYVNHCPHAGTPLDWWPNEFFTRDRRFLACGTHGSLFEPESGKCAGGPCNGRSLFPLPVQITDDRVVVIGSDD